MTSKPLSDAVNKGFTYLINQQHADGGWCQGGGWRMGTKGARVEGPSVEDPADVANTCVAALATLLAGRPHAAATWSLYAVPPRPRLPSSPASSGSDTESLYVTDLRTAPRCRIKIGEYVDTFTDRDGAGRGQGPDARRHRRGSAVGGGADKVIAKIERHQQADGTWTPPRLGGGGRFRAGVSRPQPRSSLARRCKVSDEVLQRVGEELAANQYDRGSKSCAMGGSAGVACSLQLPPATWGRGRRPSTTTPGREDRPEARAPGGRRVVGGGGDAGEGEGRLP